MENPDKKAIATETKAMIDRFLQERVSLAAIARVTRVSKVCLYYANGKYAIIFRQLQCNPKKK